MPMITILMTSPEKSSFTSTSRRPCDCGNTGRVGTGSIQSLISHGLGVFLVFLHFIHELLCIFLLLLHVLLSLVLEAFCGLLCLSRRFLNVIMHLLNCFMVLVFHSFCLLCNLLGLG